VNRQVSRLRALGVTSLLWLCLAARSVYAGEAVSIGFFVLFEPQALQVTAIGAEDLEVFAAADGKPLAKLREARLTAVRGGVHVNGRKIAPAGESLIVRTLSGRIELAVPGRIERRFQGELRVSAQGGALTPVVEMDRETAVASVTAAESPPGAGAAALRAQAVAARSYYAAHERRHARFAFCDTTHCQFLREPPPAGHPARAAAEATRGLVLAWRGAPLPALYSRSCGGRTKSAAEVGLAGEGYPFYPVPCGPCRREPETWRRRLTPRLAGRLLARPFTEAARLAVARRAGWDAVPGNSYTLEQQGGAVVLEGRGRGHGLGLCQRGAAGMASAGADFQTILRHYFPNTELLSLSE